jgi:transposase-like protein
MLERCPACGADEFAAVVDLDEVTFLCQACGRCWRVELGYVSRVDPLTCAGCPHREECLAQLARESDAAPTE